MIFAQTLAAILLAAGTSYLLLAIVRVARWEPRTPQTGDQPPVTVMVPAHGLRPGLYECLRSVCRQDYPDYQIVFGLHAGDDPARPLIERLMAEHPGRGIALVVDERRVGANPKNCNLANMMTAVRRPVLVMVDDDVLLEPDFLSKVVPALFEPGVGGATCLFSGLPAPEAGLPARLGALAINDWFIPSALVDTGRREMDLAYGPAIAVHRSALDAIGGFEAMASAVAQDYVLGHDLHRHGFKVTLAPPVVSTAVGDGTFRALWRRELRWSRTVRAVRPAGHALSIVTSPLLPFVLLAGWSWPVSAWLPAAAVMVALRVALHRSLRRRIGLPPSEPWLLPLREALNAVVWAASLTGRRIRWGAVAMVTGKGPSMRAEGRGEAPVPRE